ncbi:MAG TPA: response regulator transcription factor [Vicinamibacterales bacterium]|nr:response regulator transcription factor [Vicinamibacterales bacterium]
MPDAPIRIVLADDHPIVLQGLEHLFQRHRDFSVVASCASGDEALAAVRRGGVDVLVLDLRMPGITGLDVLRALATESASCRVVVLTATVSDDHAAEAIRLGALGLVLKESSPDVLLECVRRVHAGERWIDHGTMERAVGVMVRREAALAQMPKSLTRRELEIVRLVGEGLRNREIAQRLFVTEGTIKLHLHNVYEKLGVDGRMELLLRVQSLGLI